MSCEGECVGWVFSTVHLVPLDKREKQLCAIPAMNLWSSIVPPLTRSCEWALGAAKKTTMEGAGEGGRVLCREGKSNAYCRVDVWSHIVEGGGGVGGGENKASNDSLCERGSKKFGTASSYFHNHKIKKYTSQNPAQDVGNRWEVEQVRNGTVAR